jgi:hypothetical protein
MACHSFGKCTTGAAGGDACVVASDADCRGSIFCASSGYCTRVTTPDGIRCLPGGDADCQQSEVCLKFGQCSWHPDRRCR